ncbi:hypothetical protein [Halalkalicoccus salilacus]|uniref:hypothetical protein n=1 Tax=Halalkalicoccus TaxID=332246 RepID=UPI002F969B96
MFGHDKVDATAFGECQTEIENIAALLGLPIGESTIQVDRDLWCNVTRSEDRNRRAIEIFARGSEIERRLTRSELPGDTKEHPQVVLGATYRSYPEVGIGSVESADPALFERVVRIIPFLDEISDRPDELLAHVGVRVKQFAMEPRSGPLDVRPYRCVGLIHVVSPSFDSRLHRLITAGLPSVLTILGPFSVGRLDIRTAD